MTNGLVSLTASCRRCLRPQKSYARLARDIAGNVQHVWDEGCECAGVEGVLALLDRDGPVEVVDDGNQGDGVHNRSRTIRQHDVVQGAHLEGVRGGEALDVRGDSGGGDVGVRAAKV